MPPNPTRILFVDDEPSIRMMLPPILQQHGFEVRVAATVPEALVEINSYDFDVLIADLNIEKQGDGFLVVSAMRHIQPACVNLILTGYPALESALQAIHNQVDDYLVKPTDIDLLLKTIGEKLEARSRSQPVSVKRLSVLLKENAAEIQRQFLAEIKQDPQLQKGLSDEACMNQLPALLTGLVAYLDGQGEGLSGSILNSAAAGHARLRKKQSFTISMLCKDFQVIQQAVYKLVRRNLDAMSIGGLLADLERFQAGLNSAMAKSIEIYANKTKRLIA